MRATLLFISLLFAIRCQAIELVMFANDKPAYHTNKAKAMAGQAVAGNIISIQPDGQIHGSGVKQPTFIVLKIPGVTNLDLARKWLMPQVDTNGDVVRFREWQYKITNLTTVARRVFTNNSVTIKATGGDLSWSLFKTNLWNWRTGTTETNELK